MDGEPEWESRPENGSLFHTKLLLCINMTKRQRRSNKISKGQPMQVVTVPTLLRPTYSVPVSFDMTASGDILVPSSLLGRSHRVTSMRATAISSNAGPGNLTIGLANGAANNISVQTRTIPVTSAPIEIILRNNRFVQHSNAAGTTILATLGMTNCRLIGVIMVSVLGTF